MPAFTLYSFPGSTNSDRVRLTLAEGGFTDYEVVTVNPGKGELKTEEHLKRHPWGKVPAATFPDGFTLYESRAISKYLARKYSFPLLPKESDIEALALFEQAESIEAFNFAPPAGRVNFELFAKKNIGLTTDEAAVSESLRLLESFFDVVDGVLQQHGPYIAGKDFSLVDIYYVPLTQRLIAAGHGDIIHSRKAVSAWWNSVVNRPAIQKVLATG